MLDNIQTAKLKKRVNKLKEQYGSITKDNKLQKEPNYHISSQKVWTCAAIVLTCVNVLIYVIDIF